ncbi:MAG: TM2 domain-containing protein, partial [Gammaproteobacteria bacterium]
VGEMVDGKIVKSKIVAFILAWFLGGFGGHKFYCGQIGMGVVYLIFCWTFIPAIIAFIEGIIYLTVRDDETFTKRYCI